MLKELQDQLFSKGATLSNGQPLEFVRKYSDKSTGNKSTFFPLHSLRVSLITTYALEGGVPLSVLSKLIAGHSRLISTIYYVKITPSIMKRKMEEAHKSLNLKEEQNLKDFLSNANEQQILNNFSFKNKSSIQAALVCRNPIGWAELYIGLCLMGRNITNNDLNNNVGGCHNGGELMKDSKNPQQRIYGPVPHGPENCVQCRWFITDSSHLLQLIAHLNFLSYRASEAACSGLIIPDTILGGKVTTLEEVFNDKKASFIYSRI